MSGAPGHGSGVRRLRWAAGTTVAVAVSLFSSLAAVAFWFGDAAPASDGRVLVSIAAFMAALGSATALAWRDRFPVLVCCATSAVALAFPLDAFAPVLALTWVLAASSVRVAAACGAAAGGAVVAAVWRMSQWETPVLELSAVGYVAIGGSVIAGTVAVGLARRWREQARSALRGELRQTAVAAELRTELSRQEERNQIAREVHDTVAHTISLVSLQAAALEVTADDPTTDVRDAARTLRSTAHQALEEMRALVATLREQGSGVGSPGGDARAPTLVDVPGLVSTARAAGADVASTVFVTNVEAAPRQVSRAAYRVVQEALTNALKHVPASRVEIALAASPGAGVRITVRNPLPASSHSPPPPPQAGLVGGAGLVGLRERVALLGGTIEAGPRDGWWVVEADLPWGVPGDAEVPGVPT